MNFSCLCFFRLTRIRNLLAVFIVMNISVSLAEQVEFNAEQVTAIQSATGANTEIRKYAGSASGIKHNLTDPLTSSKPMTTFDGTKFNTQVGCEKENVALEVTIVPGETGDIDSMIIAQDLDADGTMDNTSQSPIHVSGICTNGLISCDKGTWNSCGYYRWKTNLGGVLSLEKVKLTELGGCYCINHYCGNNLVMGNLSNVLANITGGAIAKMSEATQRYSPSRFQAEGVVGRYYVNSMGDCQNPPQVNAHYKVNPQKLNTDAWDAANADKTYELITTSKAANESESAIKNCTIDRRITTTVDVLDIPSCEQDTWYAVLRSPRDFDKLGDDALVEVHAYCDTSGPLQFRFRAWDGSGRSDCNAMMGADDEGYVTVTTDASDSIVDGYTMTRPNLHRKRCFDVPVFYSGGCTSKTGRCDFDFTFYNGDQLSTYGVSDAEYDNNYQAISCENRVLPNDGVNCVDTPDGGSVVYARKRSLNLTFTRPHIKPFIDLDSCRIENEWIDNSCESLEIKNQCSLLAESIDGVNTIKQFTPTGLFAMPSTRSFDDGVCAMNFTRSWWQIERDYRCLSNRSFDFSEIVERVGYIEQNTNLEKREYKDQQLINGQLKEVPTIADLKMPVVDLPSCTQVCKTRKPIDNNDVGTFGLSSDLRVEETSFEFSYKECDTTAVCPVGVGEEMVSDCACLDEFGEAAAMINVLREGSRDLICTSGTEAKIDVPIPPP